MSAEIKTIDSDKCLYIPEGYAARTMMIGSNWNKINIGIRVNLRLTNYNPPHTLPTSGKRLWFGICSGTTNPVGVETPSHFIGYRSSRAPITEPAGGGFILGWGIVSVENGSITVQEEDTHAANRTMIVGQTDAAVQGGALRAQGIYLQLEKLSSTSMKVTLFRPPGSGPPVITEAQFVTAVETATLSTSITNHSTYELDDDTFNFDEGTYGDLDSVNLFTDFPDQTTGDKVASFRFLSVKVHKFS